MKILDSVYEHMMLALKKTLIFALFYQIGLDSRLHNEGQDKRLSICTKGMSPFQGFLKLQSGYDGTPRVL